MKNNVTKIFYENARKILLKDVEVNFYGTIFVLKFI